MSDGTEVPELELDFGVGRLYVKGDENTSFEDVVREFNDQKAHMVETIEQLKRLEEDLREGDDGDSKHFQ